MMDVVRCAKLVGRAVALLAALSCQEQAPLVATDLVFVSGNGQSAVAGTAVTLPPTVKVVGSNGQGMPGVTVTFAVTSGGGTIAGATQTTNAEGIASASWTLGTIAGANGLSASAGSLNGSPVRFTATGTPGPPARVVSHAGTGQTGRIGTVLPVAPVFKVTDANGNGVTAVEVEFSVASGGGTLSATMQTTATDGTASPGTWTLGYAAGQQSIAASVATVATPGVISASATPGPPGGIFIVAGNGQTATVGTAVSTPPSVKVTDHYGNGIPLMQVDFNANNGGAATGNPATTNAEGIATVGSWTLGTRAGHYSMNAQVQAAPDQVITISAVAVAGPAASIAMHDGNQQSARTGVSVTNPPSVIIKDAHGNPVAETPVEFAVIEGGGTVTGASSTSASTGIARVGSWTLGSLGTNRLSATASGLQGSPVVFTATAHNNCSLSSLPFDFTITQALIPTSDCTFDEGFYVDKYSFSLTGQTGVRIVMSSAEFDTYLIIVDASGTPVAFDDDGGGGTDSRIQTTLPFGSYTLYVTSAVPGATGAYSLTAQRTPASCPAVGNVMANSTTPGSLSTDDCVLSDWRYADPWVLTLTATMDLTVDLTGDFDTYLYVTRQNGTVVAQDNDAGEGTNSHVEVTLTAGTYAVWATSAQPEITGTYSLNLTAELPPCATLTPISLGQTLSGALSTTDCLRGSFYTDLYRFTLAQHTRVNIDQSSVDFDAFLLLTTSTGGLIAFDDDGGSGSDARITMDLPAGTYHIQASSFNAFVVGAYQLSLSVSSGVCSVAGSIAVGQTVGANLDTTDCRLADGSYADVWQLVAASPTTVDLSMRSSTFDTFMWLLDAAGNTIAWDDDGGDGTNARIQIALAAGTYFVYANSFAPSATGAYELIAAEAGADQLNLVIDQLHLTQASQDTRGRVPIVANRDALVRVFVRATQPNSARPAVRLRIYDGATLLETRTLAAPGASTPTNLLEGSLTGSWNTLLGRMLVRPGLRLLADVDPDNVVAESSETDNAFPATGEAAPVTVTTMPTFNLTLVPVLQSVNGRLGNVTAENQEALTSMTRAVWPLAETNTIVRTPYTTTRPSLQSNDGNGSWGAVLSEIDVLRVSEAPTRYYYGVVNVAYSSGIAGVGYLGRPTAIGWDAAGSAGEVLAHELGHNFNRLHAPCGGPAGPDPNCPYANAAIGVYGYDSRSGTLKDNDLPDLMSYCSNPWISDYTFTRAMNWLTATAPAVVSEHALVFWGRIDGNTAVLEPVIEMPARPSRTPGGAYRLRGFDTAEKTVLDVAFDPVEVGDSRTGAKHFTLAIAKSRLGAAVNELARIEVTGPGLAAAAMRGPSSAAKAVAPAASARRFNGIAEVTWDAQAFPMAVVRSRKGEILSLARDGKVALPADDGELSVELLDGIRSHRVRVLPR